MGTAVDIEVTSDTTARAVLPESDLEPVDLTATEDQPLDHTVLEFVRDMARRSGDHVDVVYRKGDSRRLLTAEPDGRVRKVPDSETNGAPGTNGTAVNEAGSIVVGAPAADTPAADTPAADASVPDPGMVAGPVDDPTGPVVVTAEPAGPVVVTADTLDTPAAPQQSTPVAPQRSTPRAYSDTPRRNSAGARSDTARPGRPRTERAPIVTAPRTVSPAPAKRGVRGRMNTALGFKLSPTPHELRLRSAATVIAGPVPGGATIAVVNVKGGVGKTPITLGLAAELATHRGPGTVAALDLGETNNSFVDRVATPPDRNRDSLGLLDATDDGRADLTSSGAVSRFLIRQPSGEDVLSGRPDADYDLGHDDAALLGSLLSRYRDLVVVDTGNAALAGRWTWSVTASDVVLVPVPLRADAASVARRTLSVIAEHRSDALASVIVVITDGPGDNPAVESDVVEQLVTDDGVGAVVRMPYEPVFASGGRISADDLARDTRDALTVLGSTVIEAMGARMG